MNIRRPNIAVGIVCAAAHLAASAPAVAQGYPTKPVRMIIPFAAGGATDVVIRIVANRLPAVLGQQVVIDNRTGAGGLIGTEIAAKANPDGYTLLATGTLHVIVPHLYRKAVPVEGWHCSHLYYRWDRGVLAAMSPAARRAARAELAQILNPDGPLAPSRLQTSVVSGPKADFGLMRMDAHPLKIEAVNQALLSSRLGPALLPAYSFVSITEISEYVPSVEQYGHRLVEEGEVAGSPAYNAKSSRIRIASLSCAANDSRPTFRRIRRPASTR